MQRLPAEELRTAMSLIRQDAGIDNQTAETLAQLVIALREEGRLCIIHEEEQTQEPRIICSLELIVG